MSMDIKSSPVTRGVTVRLKFAFKGVGAVPAADVVWTYRVVPWTMEAALFSSVITFGAASVSSLLIASNACTVRSKLTPFIR